jgi:serine/threonine protein kinase
MFWKKKWMVRTENSEDILKVTSINDDDLNKSGPRKFSYEELVSATKNFSEDRRLGKGGFGTVYRGFLPDVNMEVAVKKISRTSKQGKTEYMTEIKIISQLRHRNLVKLIGWCHERGNLLLVYEFMPNGSLDSHLFRNKRTPALSWEGWLVHSVIWRLNV